MSKSNRETSKNRTKLLLLKYFIGISLTVLLLYMIIVLVHKNFFFYKYEEEIIANNSSYTMSVFIHKKTFLTIFDEFDYRACYVELKDENNKVISSPSLFSFYACNNTYIDIYEEFYVDENNIFHYGKLNSIDLNTMHMSCNCW